MPPELAHLLLVIEEKLNWGPSKDWQTRDFDNLHDMLFDKTGVSLSNSTLRRLWGRVSYGHIPSMATLDTLATFAGFTSWRAFVAAQKTEQPVPAPSALPHKKKPPLYLFLPIGGIILFAIFYCFLHFKPAPAVPNSFVLKARRITNNIPNSVVFNYEATNAATDSLFIQQSWDSRTKTAVNKKQHTLTSIYYEPGFFHAKLLAGPQIVKEDTVMIPTNGWVGYIRQFPVPVYLEPKEFLTADKLELPDTAFEKKGLSSQSPVPFTIYANVGNMERVPVTDFNFHADVRNGYKKGAAICETSFIGLITDDEPIFIQLSNPGCISDLALMAGNVVISGKTTDLSGFGADMASWVSVDCNSSASGMDFFVNGKKAYTVKPPKAGPKILGLVFMFRGAGSVKNIALKTHNKTVLSAFRPVAGILR